MKKGIVVICVLVLLALLAVPVLAEALTIEGGFAWLKPIPVPKPPPGVYREASVEDPVLIAGGRGGGPGWFAP